ncbi:MAG: hypothetical protein ACTJG2_00710 [Candidatus Saccharimonadales bacterium]
MTEQAVSLVKIYHGKQGTFEVTTENSVYRLKLEKTGAVVVTGGRLDEPLRGFLESAELGEGLHVSVKNGPRLRANGYRAPEMTCPTPLFTTDIQRIVRV